MTKKHVRPAKKRVRGHEQIAVTALAVVTVCTLAGGDLFLNAPDSPGIAHANTSANPYQPVGTYIPPTYGIPPYTQTTQPSGGFRYSSSVSPARRTAIERKLTRAKRSAAAVEKQIQHAEDSIDALQHTIDATPGRRNDALEGMILSLNENLARLDKKLADLNSQIAAFEILLDPSKDQSR